jgi:hypothetical protein
MCILSEDPDVTQGAELYIRMSFMHQDQTNSGYRKARLYNLFGTGFQVNPSFID